MLLFTAKEIKKTQNMLTFHQNKDRQIDLKQMRDISFRFSDALGDVKGNAGGLHPPFLLENL